jgi:hypothetical protein
MSLDTCPTNLLPALRVRRHKPGRGNDVSAAEAKEIQLCALLEGLPMQALADRFGRTRRTISRVLRRPTFQAMKDQIDAETVTEARQVLASHRTTAAQAWIRAMQTAAQKGWHQGARDLLLHTGTIDPVTQNGSGPSVVVNIGTGTAGESRSLPDIVWRDGTAEETNAPR